MKTFVMVSSIWVGLNLAIPSFIYGNGRRIFDIAYFA
jgi:hypothetical protein